MVIGLIILAIVVILVIYVIAKYNGLVTLRQRVRNGFSQIDVQLQRRFDLIPNLIETVKGYMEHESGVLEKILSFVLYGQVLKQLQIKQI